MNMNNVKFTIFRHLAGRLHIYQRKNLAKETPDIFRFIYWCTLVCLVEKFQEQFDESTK
jgi:hypothetical protein